MPESEPLRVAIAGCGNIAGRYAQSIATKPEKATLIAAYDVDPTRTAAFVAEHGCRPCDDLNQLLADPEVEAVINLTSHHAHAQVTRAALEAGKHVHSEKPLAGSWTDGRQCVDLAEARGLRLSCSPFTFLGEAQQTILRALQDGRIGRVLAVYTEMNWGKIESWHADPEGFYQSGAGPLLDVGVYALTLVTTLLGPVQRVTGFAGIALSERVIARGPRAGDTFPVATPDLVVGGLEFASGVLGRLTSTFIFRGTKQASGTELHGERGSLFISSNHDFNARVEQFDEETREWSEVPYLREPHKGVEWGRAIFELSDVLRRGAPQRVTGRQSLHVLEVCLGILKSAEEGRPVEIACRFDPPEPVDVDEG